MSSGPPAAHPGLCDEDKLPGPTDVTGPRAGQGVWCQQPHRLSPQVWTLAPFTRGLTMAEPCSLLSHATGFLSSPFHRQRNGGPQRGSNLSGSHGASSVGLSLWARGPRPHSCSAVECGQLGSTALGRATCRPPGPRTFRMLAGLAASTLYQIRPQPILSAQPATSWAWLPRGSSACGVTAHVARGACSESS